MKKIILFSLLIVLVLGACRKGEIRECSEPDLGWHLYGYDTSQLSVFYINTYEKGTHFANQLTHTVTGTAFSPDSVYGPDTVAYEVSFYAHPFPDEVGGHIDARSDYEFIFPIAGRTFQLRDMVSEPSTERYDREGGEQCVRAFQYYLNDTLHTYPVSHVSNKGSMAAIIILGFKRHAA